MTGFAQWLGRGAVAIAAIALALILGLVVTQVGMRFGLGRPLPWPEELSRILFIYLVFIGAAQASITRTHIAVDVVDVFGLPRRVDRALSLLRDVAMIGVLVVIIIGAWRMIPVVHSMRLPATGVRMSLMVVPILVGSGLMLIASLLLLVAHAMGRDLKVLISPRDEAV